jgi:hypothetical protein
LGSPEAVAKETQRLIVSYIVGELCDRLLRLRVELAAMERLFRLSGNKAHLRLLADHFDSSNQLEIELLRTGKAEEPSAVVVEAEA